MRSNHLRRWRFLFAKGLACFLVLVCSPALLLALDYARAIRHLDSATNDAARLQVLIGLKADLPKNSPIAQAIDAAESEPANSEALNQAVDLVRARAFLETGSPAKGSESAQAMARDITASPVYRDRGDLEESNWIERAFERLARQLNRPRQITGPGRLALPTGGIDWFVILVWCLLCAAVLLFLILAIRSFSVKKSLRRKAMALMNADEPERSADEWLEAADKLTAERRFREAVRCLYLASLLRLDEFGVARFDRNQTNWEHLHRIEASPKKPPDLNFRDPTQSFDSIWYGMIVRGPEDVLVFRTFYERLMAALHGRLA